jgi:hypothetical protein
MTKKQKLPKENVELLRNSYASDPTVRALLGHYAGLALCRERIRARTAATFTGRTTEEVIQAFVALGRMRLGTYSGSARAFYFSFRPDHLLNVARGRARSARLTKFGKQRDLGDLTPFSFDEERAPAAAATPERPAQRAPTTTPSADDDLRAVVIQTHRAHQRSIESNTALAQRLADVLLRLEGRVGEIEGRLAQSIGTRFEVEEGVRQGNGVHQEVPTR